MALKSVCGPHFNIGILVGYGIGYGIQQYRLYIMIIIYNMVQGPSFRVYLGSSKNF